MFREASNADFVLARRFLFRRFRFVVGGSECERPLSAAAYAAQRERQQHEPVTVAEQGRRRYWWYHDRFWWSEHDLAQTDVQALVAERERGARRRLERAHLALRNEQGETEVARRGIPLEVKRRVWQRCGGRCAECGSRELLEFDHIIPLALNGSNGERNLQLLCVDCNRAKGGDL